MRDRDLLHSLVGLCPIGDVVHGVKNVSAIIPSPTSVTNSNYNVFEDDKSLFVLKGLPLNLLGTNLAFAVLTAVAVSGILIVRCGFHRL